MTFEELKALDDAYIMHTYGRFPVDIDHGEGATLYSLSGRKYIDFTSGIGVNSLGYGNEKWMAAITAQIGKLGHISNLFYTQPGPLLARELCTRSGLSKVFFGNSGAEANEAMIKVARKYSFDKYGKGRSTVITLNHSFHGRTITTLTATGQDSYHNYFFPFNEAFRYADPTLESVQAQGGEDVCGVMLELIQGEGGVRPLDPKEVQAIAALCREKDWLLLVDEVQTGIGRTGTFYAYQGYGIEPDVVTTAKGIAGGLPMGACLVSEALGDILTPGQNGSTFGGNPVACAGARVVVRRVSDPAFLQSVTEKGAYLKARLEALPQVEYVRGKGLMLGAKLKDKDAHEVLVQCAGEGLLVLTAKDLVRFLPPLTITKEDMDQGLAIFQKVLEA